MTTIFRFAIQTDEYRCSEIWSFYSNKKVGCLYATRASMREWLKISFHESGACHIKSYEKVDGRLVGAEEHAWTAPAVESGRPGHLMRLTYDLQRQGARLPRTDRVPYQFESWGAGGGSVSLNVYASQAGFETDFPQDTIMLADRMLGNNRRVVFVLQLGGPQRDLPEGMSNMILHMGEPTEDPESPVLNNMTAIWYAIPERRGTLTMIEASAARFSLEHGRAI